MGEAALDEVFAAARAPRIGPTIEQLKQKRVESAPILDLEPVADLAESRRPGPTSLREPWERGVALAHLVRQHVGLLPDEPVGSKLFADLVGQDVTVLERGSVDLAAGFRSTDCCLSRTLPLRARKCSVLSPGNS